MTPRQETLDAVTRIVAEACAIAPTEVSAKGRLAGYGVDSVRLLELVVMLEDHFALSVDETALASSKVQTVLELASLVEALLAQKQG